MSTELYNISVYDAQNTDRLLGTLKTCAPAPSETSLLIGLASFEWFWRELTPTIKCAVLKTCTPLRNLMVTPEFSLPE